MSYGRGGSGNIERYQKAQDAAAPENAKSTTHKPGNASAASDKQTGSALKLGQEQAGEASSNVEGERPASSGRGGAGNILPQKSIPIRRGPPPSPSQAADSRPEESRIYGRGGAGNFDAENRAAKQREEALQRKLDRIHEVAEKSVESRLQKPGRAVVRHPEEEFVFTPEAF